MITASGALSGGNFVVSAYSSRTQRALGVIYSEDAGEFLAVWDQWQSTNNYDVYGQRLSGGGALLDNAGTQDDESGTAVSFAITSQGDDQTYAKVAYDGTGGNYLAVWLDERNYASAGYDVYGQIITASGALSGGNLALATAGYEQRWPAVAPLAGAGDFLVVWGDQRSGSWGDVYGQRVAGDGGLAASNELLIEDAGYLYGLAVAGHASAPELLVTLEANYEIYAQRYGVLVADFEATPLYGSAPLTVTFSNDSTPASEISGYEWAYGDGITSTTSAATHTHAYTAPGVYTVTLTATGRPGPTRGNGRRTSRPTRPSRRGPTCVATGGWRRRAAGARTPPGRTTT